PGVRPGGRVTYFSSLRQKKWPRKGDPEGNSNGNGNCNGNFKSNCNCRCAGQLQLQPQLSLRGAGSYGVRPHPTLTSG
ncbi:MAG: hypothetical protein ABWY05_00315, partial [Noviherbaspirillum sp.]